jgi:hypothetical protein
MVFGLKLLNNLNREVYVSDMSVKAGQLVVFPERKVHKTGSHSLPLK